MHVDHDDGRAAFLDGLDAFVGCVESFSDLQLMAASRCTGWTVVDVVVHVHLGLQEMLLGLVNRTVEEADTDASTYWRATPPTNDDDADQVAGMRFIRLLGASYRRPSGAVRHMLPTVEGVRAAASRLEPGAARFQGHVLSSGDFLATWAVELAVHHLDMGRELAVQPPAPSALRLARLTVEALAGADAPRAWADDATVLLGAGRIRPDAEQQTEAPVLTRKLPVLG
jgi:Mycothiol maleylpyruvate isomerase N-terminal domain